ncbi:hypothetical protein HJFPF1_08278 [Paramyrothecium foliicola]|nr:hypothetical protein HJFPF1_08278 [Paramyrothecium foliicola]
MSAWTSSTNEIMESQSAAKSPSLSTGGVAQNRQFSAASSSKPSAFFGENLHSEMSRKHEEENFLDSGYGSQDSSQAATPDRLAVNESGSDPKERGIELRLSRTKTLLAFNDEIDELYTSRFYSIQPTIESLLLQYIKRKSFLRGTGRHKPMAIRLLFLGNSELDARPHIVVFCAPEMRKRVQHFFDKDDLVKAFYKPDDASLPSFDVVVCECAPQLRNGETVVEVFCDATANLELAKSFVYKSFVYNTPFEGTFCGTPIRLQANGKTRNATLGGLLKLEYDTGETELVGLTAGHAVRACSEAWADQDALDDDFGANDNASTVSSFVDSESDCSQSESDETPIEDSDSQSSKNQAVGEHNHAQAWAFEHPKAFGDVRSQGDGAQKGPQVSTGSLDWALINLKDFKPNRLPSFMFHGQSDAWKAGLTKCRNQSPSTAEALSEDRVILICGSSSPKYGYLASQPARILIDMSDVFVDAFMVVLDAGDEVVDGDSGAWVVMEETHEVIGHIVATDPLGAGYIIPLCDIFSDIQRSLGVVRVSLPSVHDIKEKQQFKSLLTEMTANADKYPPLLPEMVHNESSSKLDGRHERKHQESPSWMPYTHVPLPTAYVPSYIAVSHIPDSEKYMQMPSNAREPRGYSEDRQHGMVGGVAPPNPTFYMPTEVPRTERNRRRSGIYVNGQRVEDLATGRRASHNASSKSRSPDRKGRIVLVDSPPRPRQPPQVHYSGSDSYSHDSGYSSNGSSSRNSPNWGMTPASGVDELVYRDTKVIDRGSSNRRPVIVADTIADRLNRVSDQMAGGWQQRHAIVRIPENEEREEVSFRREAVRARIAAANREIASRPEVPLDDALGEVGGADAEQQLVASVKQLNLASGRRQARDTGRTEDTRRSKRDKVDPKDEEEAQKQRLRERMMPRRRATVELGSRRRPEPDDRGVYKWE